MSETLTEYEAHQKLKKRNRELHDEFLNTDPKIRGKKHPRYSFEEQNYPSEDKDDAYKRTMNNEFANAIPKADGEVIVLDNKGLPTTTAIHRVDPNRVVHVVEYNVWTAEKLLKELSPGVNWKLTPGNVIHFIASWCIGDKKYAGMYLDLMGCIFAHMYELQAAKKVMRSFLIHEEIPKDKIKDGLVLFGEPHPFVRMFKKIILARMIVSGGPLAITICPRGNDTSLHALQRKKVGDWLCSYLIRYARTCGVTLTLDQGRKGGEGPLIPVNYCYKSGNTQPMHHMRFIMTYDE